MHHRPKQFGRAHHRLEIDNHFRRFRGGVIRVCLRRSTVFRFAGGRRPESGHVWKNRSPRCSARNRRRDRNAATFFFAAEPTICRTRSSFTAEDSGTKDAPVIFQNYQNEKAVISGGVRLEHLDWQPYTNGIFQAKVPADLQTEEIFVNGERQILARYPNYDPKAQYFDGFTSGADIQRRATRWANPAGGYLHAMHPALWGDFTWRITGKDPNNQVKLEGGWQNNRGGGPNLNIQFVENIFEELDAPGEWFLNSKTHTLYFYPPAGLDLKNAVVEATRLRTLVEFHGDEEHPVKWITLRGLCFARRRARSWTPANRSCVRIGRFIAAGRFSSTARKIVRWKTALLIKWAVMPFSSTITTAA